MALVLRIRSPRRRQAATSQARITRRHLQIETLEDRRVLNGDFSLAGDWPTFGNGPSHTGYFPGNFGDSPGSALRWSIPLGDEPNQVAVADGRVYVTPEIRFDETYLVAFDHMSGDELWRHTFATAHNIDAPTFDDGRVYVQRGNHGQDSQLWAFDASSGLAEWSQPFSAQWERYFAPTVAEGRIWINAGYYGGMYGFDQASSSQLFFNPMAQYDEWTPTYYDGHVYSWVAGRLGQHDMDTGATNWSVDLGWNWHGWSMDTVAAISDDVAYLVGSPGLHAVDLDTQQEIWTVGGVFSGSPAVAGERVYAIQGGQLKAFDRASGLPRGVFDPGATLLAQQPIVTDDAIVVASADHTYVMSLATQQVLLTLPTGGELSLANDTLYVGSRESESLFAFDLLLLPSLLLEVPAAAREGDGVLIGQGRVSVAEPASSDLEITLVSAAPEQLTVPAKVTIREGTTFATFDLSIVDDSDLDFQQTVSLTASASGYYDDQSSTLLRDNESTSINVELPLSATEGAGLLADAGIVSVATAPTVDVPVRLTSSDMSEIAVPESVLLPAGQMSVTFDVIVVDDLDVDGPQFAVVSAEVEGWETGESVIRVEDDEPPYLTLEFASTATEGDGLLEGRLTIPYRLDTDLVVSLSSSDLSELTLPASVVVGAQQIEAIFEATVVDDALVDGTRRISVDAAATGFYLADPAVIDILDNESAELSVLLPTLLMEGDGLLPGQGTVGVDRVVDDDVSVRLVSSAPDEIAVPFSVTIPAGHDFATFDLQVLDDRRVDGTQTVTVTAEVANWVGGGGTTEVSDNDELGLPGDWSTFGNGVGHTGYFPGFFGRTPQAYLRWEAKVNGGPQQVAVGDGRVYVTPRGSWDDFASIVALDEMTGGRQWEHIFGESYSINPPTFADGRVYLQRGNHGNDSQLWSFDAASGQPIWSQPFAQQWDRYMAPTVADNRIWVNGGYYGGMYGFDQFDGAQQFFVNLPQYDEWTPTYHDGHVYSWVAGSINEYDPTSGEVIWSLDLGWDWHGWSMNTVSAIADGVAYLVGSPALHAVDLETRQELWRVEGSFSGSPAVADGVVYVVQQGRLKAFDAATGAPSGVFDADETLLANQPIVTDDTVVVASSSTTYIFDRHAQQLLLTIPVGGTLSLANDTLFVSGTSLYAYSFTTGTAHWQNQRNRYDVTADGSVTPIDALVQINRLNRSGAGALSIPEPGNAPSPYWDVDGDSFHFPADALAVINYLNTLSGLGSEGEFVPVGQEGTRATSLEGFATGASVLSTARDRVQTGDPQVGTRQTGTGAPQRRGRAETEEAIQPVPASDELPTPSATVARCKAHSSTLSRSVRMSEIQAEEAATWETVLGDLALDRWRAELG